MSAKKVMRVVAGTAGVLLVAGAAGPGAAAVTTEDSGDVQATVRKTVLQTASPTGEIATSRMYTQISAVGNGTKTVTVPVGTTSNRNLNEFGAFPMEGESIVVDLTVADGGGTEERTLTDADINPMEVSVKVMLDGVEVAPEDLVGKSGVLDVEYTVRNTTAAHEPGDLHRRRGQGDHRGRRDRGSVRGFARRHPAAGLQRGHRPRRHRRWQRPERDAARLHLRAVPAAGFGRGEGRLPVADQQRPDAGG